MRLRNLLIAAVLTSTAYAADLQIGSGMLSPDRPVELSVKLTADGEAMTSFQFDLVYDDSALDVQIETGPAAEAAGKSVSSSVLKAGRTRVLVYGVNLNSLSDGVVATLKVTLKEGSEAGKSYPVRVEQLLGTTAASQKVAIAGHEGTVRVEGKRRIR